MVSTDDSAALAPVRGQQVNSKLLNFMCWKQETGAREKVWLTLAERRDESVPRTAGLVGPSQHAVAMYLPLVVSGRKDSC